MDIIKVSDTGNGRLLQTVWPEIRLHDTRHHPEDIFQIHLNNVQYGTAKLEYVIPFHVSNLKETHAFLVYGLRPDQVKRMLVKQAGGEVKNCYLDFLLFRWINQDLHAMSEMYQARWNRVMEENAEQMQMHLSF
jgi:hypothetical protein